jgi:tRNA modification GTPase
MPAIIGEWGDTIVALASAAGVGAIGVIRLSGDQSIPIVDALFPSKDLSAQNSNTLHVGWLRHQGKDLDEVVVSLFRAPKSYTGEDVVELSCHGSPLIEQEIIQAILVSGARLSRPGEFTLRAFLNKKMDLVQAEAVADLIAGTSEAAKRTALNAMRGGFSKELSELRERLLRFSALIELELDFSQEDVEFADRKQLYTWLDEAAAQTKRLLESFRLGNVFKNGVQVAIIGKPNSGKSTLLNALLNEERAIVSEVAGTTRDSIEEVLHIEGIAFRLIDTAGIRHPSTDPVESMGMERSRQKMRDAELVIYLFDAAQTSRDELTLNLEEVSEANGKLVLVGNKIDQWMGPEEEEWKLNREIVLVSAKEGRNIHSLKQRLLASTLSNKVAEEGIVITNSRHMDALKLVSVSIEEIRRGLDKNIPGDLLSIDIRRCLQYIGEITGEVSTSDQLDYIFSKFCIGK